MEIPSHVEGDEFVLVAPGARRRIEANHEFRCRVFADEADRLQLAAGDKIQQPIEEQSESKQCEFLIEHHLPQPGVEPGVDLDTLGHGFRTDRDECAVQGRHQGHRLDLEGIIPIGDHPGEFQFLQAAFDLFDFDGAVAEQERIIGVA